MYVIQQLSSTQLGYVDDGKCQNEDGPKVCLMSHVLLITLAVHEKRWYFEHERKNSQIVCTVKYSMVH